MITLEEIKKNYEVNAFIELTDRNMKTMGYTDHGTRHVNYVAATAGNILAEIGEDNKLVELAKIAGYLHDTGNVINREHHEESSAQIAYTILRRMGMDIKHVLLVMTAIGNHDERTGAIVNKISAALVLADKSDIHFTRVLNMAEKANRSSAHYYVNFATKKNWLAVDKKNKMISLNIKMDLELSSPMDLFSIYSSRIVFCEKAAEFLGYQFRLVINEMPINTDNKARAKKISEDTSKPVSAER